jgi:hypothetical protein
MVAGHSIRSIAVRLGRAPSTISRELGRNGGNQDYRANQADELARERARRPKVCCSHLVGLPEESRWQARSAPVSGISFSPHFGFVGWCDNSSDLKEP